MDKPCKACPWMSRDERDKEAISDPKVQESMLAGNWFCCHVNMGTCHGAAIRHKQSLGKEPPDR
jgi:hypothetical protein